MTGGTPRRLGHGVQMKQPNVVLPQFEADDPTVETLCDVRLPFKS